MDPKSDTTDIEILSKDVHKMGKFISKIRLFFSEDKIQPEKLPADSFT